VAAAHAYTIVEVLAVLTLIGAILAVAVPRVKLGLDRISVQAAAREVVATISWARMLAIGSHSSVAVDVVHRSGALRVRRGSEIVVTRPIGQTHAVQLTSTRDSMAYDPRGLGRGAANLSIVVRRGAAVETVFVSRLGRIR
jgi:Tfp pilus assembly protein FimT